MSDEADPLSRYNDRIFGLLLASWEGIKQEILNPVPLKGNFQLYKENFIQCLLYYERLWEHDERTKLAKLLDSDGSSDNVPRVQDNEARD